MPPIFHRTMQVSDGVTPAEPDPTREELYATPEELQALYGCSVTEESIRFIQTLINTHCCRTSLWPVEIEEPMLELPVDRQETRLTVTPVVKILEAAGRFGFGRRDRQGWNNQQYGLASILALVGSQPQWTSIDISQVQFDPTTGMVWLPFSSWFVPWTYAKMRYVAGYITMPSRLKAAIALIANEMHAKGVSDRVRYGVGKVTRGYAGDTFLSKQAQQLLQPFVIQTM